MLTNDNIETLITLLDQNIRRWKQEKIPFELLVEPTEGDKSNIIRLDNNINYGETIKEELINLQKCINDGLLLNLVDEQLKKYKDIKYKYIKDNLYGEKDDDVKKVQDYIDKLLDIEKVFND